MGLQQLLIGTPQTRLQFEEPKSKLRCFEGINA